MATGSSERSWAPGANQATVRFGDGENKLTTAWTARRLAEGEKRYDAESLGDLKVTPWAGRTDKAMFPQHEPTPVLPSPHVEMPAPRNLYVRRQDAEHSGFTP